MITVLILEDNQTLGNRFKLALEGWSFVVSVKLVGTITEAKCAIEKNEYDILLADMNLPDGCGTEAISLYVKKNTNGIAIVVSAYLDAPTILNAIECGAVGYLHKDDSSFEIIEAVKLSLRGESPISPSIAYSLIKNLSKSSVEAIKLERDNHSILTAREVEVLTLLSKGLTYTEAASILNLSSKTIPVHVRNIYRKLQVKNRTEALSEAVSLGILP